MSEINYQALREAAERAIPAMERLLMLPADDDLLSEQELKDYGVDIDALNAFKFLAGPETVLALLDERERNQQYIKSRDQENEDIALTVGKLRVELEAEKQRAKDLFMENARLKSGIAGLIHLGIRYADVDVMKIAGDLPPGWGLLHVVNGRVRKVHGWPKGNCCWGNPDDKPFTGNKQVECDYMLSALRRMELRGHLNEIYDGVIVNKKEGNAA
ncbi:ead/Ea22-like family protein [Escherichia coli]|uniref:ead/Ea22-like family protein n=12 Tax=Escherichia coli TaxID=562 RepID=UPI0024A81309|nr:ead/Ea22-like family protein [Escherichia coli]MDI6012888.1 ead/Ea22-like family protein [Escherichia coli]